MKIYFPPKPMLININQNLFGELEKRKDVVCEFKYNGTRLILYRHCDGNYEFYSGFGKKIKYEPSKELLQQLDFVEWEGEVVLDGELLNFRTKNIKHRIILFDVFVWNGTLITDLPFSQRRKLLEDKMITTFFNNNFLILAPQWRGGQKDCFRKIYESIIKYEEIEGLVIKSLNTKALLGRNESPIVSYMWKVRKPGPTYRF